MLATSEIDGPGAYILRCVVNGRVYVGSSSISVMRRKKQHFAKLRLGKHYSRIMQADFNLYGESAFVFDAVGVNGDGDSAEIEQALIDQYDATNPERGYNSREIAYSRSGRPKKDIEEVLVIITVRVPQDVKKIADKWGKKKGEKIAAAIRAEKAREG